MSNTSKINAISIEAVYSMKKHKVNLNEKYKIFGIQTQLESLGTYPITVRP